MDYLAILRQFRVGPFTIFDTVLAYVGIFLLAPLLSKVFVKLHLTIYRTAWLWLTLPIGVLFHLLFRQDTPLMRMLFNPSQFYIPVIVLTIMLFMGLKSIKIGDTP